MKQVSDHFANSHIHAVTPTTHGLWAISAPVAPATTTLEGTISTDVAIIGGGYTGLSTALHLRAKGISAVVLEASDIGFGCSGRNSGNVNAGLWVLPDDMPAVLGPVYGPRLLDLLAFGTRVVFDIVAKYNLDCGARNLGTLHCGVGDAGRKELEVRYAQWSKRGVAVELLDAAATQARTGTDAYRASLFDPRAGLIQPLAYARGLAKAALSEGAQIYTKSPVTSVIENGDRVVVSTPKGSVSADRVIVATNAYTVFPYPEIREELVFLPYFSVSTSPLSAEARSRILPNGEGAWDTKTVLSSFRVEPDGRMVYGSVGTLDGVDGAIHRDFALREMKKLFPYIGDIQLETGWYGQIGMTTDHMPRLHRFGKRSIGFSGYNGRGIAPGTVFGGVLAQWVAGELADAELPLPVTEFANRRFRSVMEAYYRYGAVAAHAVGARV